MLKNNLKKNTPILLLLILMFILSLPTTFYADLNDNAGGSGSDGTSNSAAGGASESKYGYRFYVVDNEGAVVSKVVDFVSYQVDCDYNYLVTRLGKGTVAESRDMPEGMPVPFYHSGSSFKGNGEALRVWCLSRNSDGNQNLIMLVHNYLGADTANLFKNTYYSYYVVLEPITWHDIYKTGNKSSNTGYSFYGTFYNWMQFYNENDWGTNFTSVLEQHILGTCLQLVRDEKPLGLTNPGTYTEYFTLNNVGSAGWGIQLYYNKDIIDIPDPQTTYDEPKGDNPDKAPTESEGKITIVKNYRYSTDGGKTFKDGGCYVNKNLGGNIEIEDELSYKVKSWRVTNINETNIDSLKWEQQLDQWEALADGDGIGTIKIEGTTTLYVLLEKVIGNPEDDDSDNIDNDFKISESSITKRIRFSESTSTSKLNNHKFSWVASSLTLGDNIKYEWLDNEITVSIKNTEASNYTNILVNKEGWQNVVKNSNATSMIKYWTSADRNLTTDSKISRTSWDYMCVLKRGDDKLTIAKWKNTDVVNSLMSDLGFYVSNTKIGSRKISDYVNEFHAYFSDDDNILRDLITVYGDRNGKMETSTYSFLKSSGLGITAKVNVETYSGKSSIGNETSKGMIEAGRVSFYPYIKMKYDTYASSYSFNASQVVNVLGEYKRTVTFYDYADITKSSSEKLVNVNSNQWSTHTSVHNNLSKLLGNDDIQKILPGGVLYGISIPVEGQQKVYATTYQCVLEGDGLLQVQNTGGSVSGDMSRENAENYHSEYVSTIEEALNKVKIVQYADTDIRKKDAFDGVAVNGGVTFNGLKLNSDSKYYFNNFSTTYLNAKATNNTDKIAYVFRVDTNGNVYMNDKVVLTKGKDYTQITDKVAKEIDCKTFVVRNLLTSLETNTGEDNTAKWATVDGTWYNEAFDGITVYVQRTAIQVGLINPTERWSVLDPKLAPLQEYGMHDAGTKFHISQFGTAEYSELYGSNNKNKLGEFKGSSVYVKDLRKLFVSNPFYITNIQSQDLN